MSDIKIKPSATGSATVTLTAPATGTARTVTLPDATGTLLNSDGSGANLSGVATLDGNSNLGVGTTSPTNLGNYKTIATNDSSGGMFEIMVGGTRTANIQSSASQCNIQTRTNIPIAFDINSSEKMRLTSAGLTFNGDTAAANALDDYEEGTHVVTATMTSSGSVTLNRDTMSYTKVGRLVTCTGEIDISTTSSPSGAMKWTLPFAIANNSLDRDAYIGFKPVCYHVPFSGGIPPVAIGNTSAAHVIFVYEQHDAANASYVPYAGDAFNFTFSYITN